MFKRFVLKHEQYGYLLGLFRNTLYWTGLEVTMSVLPYYAKAWINRAESMTFLAGLGILPPDPEHYSMHPVETVLPGWAHIGECVKAGVPVWNFDCEGSTS